MTLDELVRNLSGALQRLLPIAFQLRVLDGNFLVEGPSYGPSVIIFSDLFSEMLRAGMSADEAIVERMESVLSEMQDVVTLELKIPWPTIVGSRSESAPPFVEIGGQQLRLTYSTPDAVLLESSIPWRDGTLITETR
jgi:hypothetical protein